MIALCLGKSSSATAVCDNLREGSIIVDALAKSIVMLAACRSNKDGFTDKACLGYQWLHAGKEEPGDRKLSLV